MPVRCSSYLLIVLLLGMRAAVAEDARPEELSIARAAASVREAHAAKDMERLAALARRDLPDPWLVAEELVGGGAKAAALAFARSAPRPAVARLVEYLTAHRAESKEERALRARIEQAYAAGAWQRVLDEAAKQKASLDTVPRVSSATLRGRAHVRLRQLEEGARQLLSAAAAAQALGWQSAAITAYAEGAHAAFRHSDWPMALEAMQHGRRLQLELGQARDAARALGTIGLLREKLGEFDAAQKAQSEALRGLQAAGDKVGAASALGNLGIVYVRIGAYAKAMDVLSRALAFWEEHRVQAGVAMTLGRIAVVQEKQGHFAEALATLERVALLLDPNDEAGRARTRTNTANVLRELGDLPEALRMHEEVLRTRRRLKDRAGEATTLGNIGVVYWSLADYPRAIQMLRRALALRRELHDPVGESNALGNIGSTLLEMGDYAASLRNHEAALAIQERVGDRAGAATTLGNLGHLHLELGDYARAVQRLEACRDAWEGLQNRAGMGWALSRLGILRQRMGEYAEALKLQRRALALRKEVGSRAGIADSLIQIGVLQRELGRPQDALKSLEEAKRHAEALPDRDLVARARGHLGLTYLRMGKRKVALTHLEDAIREARELRMTPILARFLGPLARLRLDLGQAGRALTEAKSAVRDLEDILGGLGEEEGATARERYVEVFNVGTLAAMRLDEKAEAVTFLESGRAGTLLESLKGRRALLWADLPEGLRTEEADAKAHEARARHALERSIQLAQPRSAQRAAKVALDATRERRREISARIQREAKRQAGVFYPRATTLEKLHATLAADAALVLYGLCGDEALALVITSKDARFAKLGSVSAVRAACAALEADDEATSPAPAVDALKKLVIAPLKLPPAIRTVLISPDGPLCYVPYALLLGKRAVALTPSGTTHVLLREEERPTGSGVLALGDPVYDKQVDQTAVDIYRGSGRLVRLPKTRDEVEAVGTVRLLGPDAHERGLRESLRGRPRWRAVHLACHGRVDPDHPMLSSLALTREGVDDGFLTCIEVLRAEIPADLVVLSACQTAKGRAYRSEGVVGLMRSFMYAGSPRVLCSLWNVDDAATLALMKRFYKLWNPATGKGLGPAEALRRAQAHVRAQKGWEHPYYWAAWVLWGLPD